jgi:UDP-glucose 4-epimerase
MNKILITGVAGFIAAHVARRFLLEGFQVVGVDDFSSGRPENVPDGVEFIQGDLADPKTISGIPSGCQVILHLAGQSSGEISFDDPVADLNKNIVSSLNLIRYGIRHKALRFVYASSMSVYGPVNEQPVDETYSCSPLSCYGVGKLATEGYLRVYQTQLPYVALRMFNVYGPGQDLSNLRQGMVSIYLAQALANGRIEVKGDIGRYRDFIFIDDVVEAWWRAAFRPEAENQIINVGTGIKTTVGELLQRVCSLVPGSDYFVNGGTPGDQAGVHANTNQLGRILDLTRFTPLDSGLKSFVEWASVQHSIFSQS